MTINEKLLKVQSELKAPKSRKNTFGNYNYRNLEDIFEGVKPLLGKYNLSLTVFDTIEEVGGRVYVKATATLTDNEGLGEITVTAYAREAESKKGMDESQVTGATSSYARKYCLNGLFLIDDTKDADTDEYKKESDARAKKEVTPKKVSLVSEDQQKIFKDLCVSMELDQKNILKKAGWDGKSKVDSDTMGRALQIINNIADGRE